MAFSKFRHRKAEQPGAACSVACDEAHVSDDDYGLHEVYRGDNPHVDIVAIHGLNGHWRNTWTSKTSKAYWLGDAELLPRSVPNSRILSYGYDAKVVAVFGKTSSQRILQHAHTLVAQLVADREFEGADERPIIFVCHSLGGIILKRALAYAQSRTSHKITHIHSIYASTYAILFLGTPHEGSDRAALAMSTRRILEIAPSKIIDTSGQLLDALEERSEVLQNITDQFAPLMKRFRIYFFWEQQKTDLGYTKDYVVEQSSAAPMLDNVERAGIPADHSGMCKFESRSSSSFKLVAGTLMRYSREAPEAVQVRWSAVKSILDAERTNEAAELTSHLTREIASAGNR